ncbi:TPA: hypothetical protein P5J61_003066, partial [Legionella pneumophila]|nr:hypothetical protein [Legionella pneumophila]
MKSILFVINEAGEFVELSKIALAIQQQGYDINFLFVSSSYINLENDCKFCEVNGFTFYYPFKSFNKLRAQKIEKEFDFVSTRNHPIENQLGNGYIPYSFLLKSKRKSYFFICPILFLISFVGIFAAITKFLCKITK